MATGRYWVVFVCLCFVGLCIFWRLFSIQTIENEIWSERGAEFRHSIRTIDPARGQIQARDGSLLATSVPVYDLRWDTKCEAIKWTLFEATKRFFMPRTGKGFRVATPEDYTAIKLDKARAGRKQVNQVCKTSSVHRLQSAKGTPIHQIREVYEWVCF